ncbi:polysaccharide pyruvyl transferase family protein [Vibrio coralliilyticus]|uniref:polysaccharide pyruvyl transferase family protein n=1 Tax=Vibrio coralliilyticus TaxID=190893 RepID=UPI0017BE85FA|nr:polysaccharide pyruvyl transferase family protein [Vibrio coralliilyticus]NUW68975.1 polysaccharide pyruvyl transferase family protein [Vibrio coralliilyticus]
MKELNVLHVASFTGNIGDNANHTGFRNNFSKHLDVVINYTEFEIRQIFWKHKSFDENFVTLANQHDLVVIGGGNYFELWVDESETGTSIDIKLELLKKIGTPIVFNALGVDPAQGATEEALKKFRAFLDFAIESPTIKLSCRNDGSIKTLKELVGERYAKEFYHVPDSGFFTEVQDFYHPELEKDKVNIVIQIAGDMIETRFPNNSDLDIGFEDFISGLANYIIRMQDGNVNFILVPHIFRDISVINKLLESLPDNIRRESVSVAPYLVGQKGQDYIFDIYKKADLILAMRFHASVCGLGLGTPCIGLVNYRQIEELYNEIDLEYLKVHVNKQNFDIKLFELSTKLLNKDIVVPANLIDTWRYKLDLFHQELSVWLKTLKDYN